MDAQFRLAAGEWQSFFNSEMSSAQVPQNEWLANEMPHHSATNTHVRGTCLVS